MPIYEYRCESCGQELEKIQKFSDPALTDCPACGKSTLKKLVSASSFRLKGSGWYETDFKNKKKPGDAGGAGGAGDDSKSEDKSKTDKTGKDGKSEKSSDKASAAKSSGTD